MVKLLRYFCFFVLFLVIMIGVNAKGSVTVKQDPVYILSLNKYVTLENLNLSIYSPLGEKLHTYPDVFNKEILKLLNLGYYADSTTILTESNKGLLKELKYSVGESHAELKSFGANGLLLSLNRICKVGGTYTSDGYYFTGEYIEKTCGKDCINKYRIVAPIRKLFNCRTTKELIEKVKIPNSWNDNNLIMYCNDGADNNVENYNIDFLTTQVNGIYKLCTLKNLDLDENNTIIFGFEVGSESLDEDESYFFNTSNSSSIVNGLGDPSLDNVGMNDGVVENTVSVDYGEYCTSTNNNDIVVTDH